MATRTFAFSLYRCTQACNFFFFFFIFFYTVYYNFFAILVPSPLAGKGEDKEYPTIGARMIRLEDKVGVLLVLSLCLLCLQAEEIKWLDQLRRLLSRVWLHNWVSLPDRWGHVLESFDMIVFWLACCDQYGACSHTLSAISASVLCHS